MDRRGRNWVVPPRRHQPSAGGSVISRPPSAQIAQPSQRTPPRSPRPMGGLSGFPTSILVQLVAQEFSRGYMDSSSPIGPGIVIDLGTVRGTYRMPVREKGSAMAAFGKSCRRRGHAGSSESDPTSD